MTVLVIAVHPDDETLGCGGTLLKHRAQGDEICWLIVTEGHEPQWSAEEIERKAEEVDRVSQAYGMSEVFRLGLPTARVETLSLGTIISKISKVVEAVKPETVYLIHGGDVHTDHQATFTAALSALKAFYMRRFGVRRVLSYETLSSTEAGPPLPHRAFIPTVFSDISRYLEPKLDIMAMYESEAQEDPMPRGHSAIHALARYRGSTIGVEYAEAFMLIREVT